MYTATAIVEAWDEDFPGSRVKWEAGQTREIHDSFVDRFRNNPAAWTVSGGPESSPMQATKTLTGGVTFSAGGSDITSKMGSSTVKPSNWLATQEFTNPTAYTGAGATFGIRRSVPFPFVGGRLVAYNAGAIPVAGDVNYVVGVANTAVVNTQATGFVAPTWGPLNAAGPVAAAMFKGTSGATVVESALSNPFVLQAIPRTDVGTGYIVEARAYTGVGVTTNYSLGTDVFSAAVQQQTAGGVSYAGFNKAGDFVTTNQAGMTTPGVASHWQFCDLLLYADASIYTVAAGGDSITRGQGATDGRSNEIRLACDALTLAGVANVNFLGHTRPGAGVDSYAPSCIDFINKFRPSIYFYTASSPNDSGLNVAATLTKTKNWLYAVKQACDQAGTILVLCTTTPWAPFSAAQSNANLAFASYLQALADSMGVQFHDRYTLTSNGATPASLLPGYNVSTGTANQQAHPNDACYAFLQPYAQTIIKTLIGK